MASLIFNAAIDAAARGLIDFDDDDFAVMLVDDSYAPDKDAHEFRNDVTGEITGTGYTAGGEDVVVGVTRDDANDRVNVELGEAEWLASTITAKGAVYYKKTGNAATDRIVAFIEFATDVTSTGGTWSLTSSILRYQNLT